MSVEVFIDTNVFDHPLDSTAARMPATPRQARPGQAERIVREGLAAGNACISHQVVQECLNVVLRKAAVPL